LDAAGMSEETLGENDVDFGYGDVIVSQKISFRCEIIVVSDWVCRAIRQDFIWSLEMKKMSELKVE
jgi:hypothetical protein